MKKFTAKATKPKSRKYSYVFVYSLNDNLFPIACVKVEDNGDQDLQEIRDCVILLEDMYKDFDEGNFDTIRQLVADTFNESKEAKG